MAIDNSYKNILKGTAIFGGTQFFTILINLIRGKLVAIFLGPEGMGISSLITASMNTIQQFSSIGLNLSIVKEISEAKEKNNEEILARIIKISRLLLFATGILGAVITTILSPYLSKSIFGNNGYTWAFILLSIAILFTTLSNGELAILQGYREVRKLAWASVVGATVGLFCGIPMYYFWGIDGIIPAIITLAFTNYLFYKTKSLSLLQKKASIIWKKEKAIIKRMILLGLALMGASLIGTITNYILNIYINQYGSIADLGMYQAANSMTNQYVGIVFTAMGLDYFPRLTAIINNKQEVIDIVNKQINIVINIMAPLCCLLILLSPLIIKILLTEDFIPVIELLRWMAIGLFLKSCAFPIGYISFAKGDKKTFFLLEGIWSNISTLTINIIFYHIYGLTGLGISLCVIYFLNFIIYIILTKKIYKFYILKKTYKTIYLLFIILLFALLSTYIKQKLNSDICMVVCTILCSFYSYKNIKENLNINK